MSKYASKYDKKKIIKKIDPVTKFVVGSKEYNAYYGLESERIDPVTKFVIGSKEYNDYYGLENYIENKGRRR